MLGLCPSLLCSFVEAQQSQPPRQIFFLSLQQLGTVLGRLQLLIKCHFLGPDPLQLLAQRRRIPRILAFRQLQFC
jgi:hypothetical protein